MTVCKRNNTKFSNAITWAAIVAAVGLLAACGGDSDSSTTPSNLESESDLVVATFDDLPVCTSKREGSTAYVKDGKTAYVCEDSNWKEDKDPESAEKSSSSKAKSSSSQKTSSSSSLNKDKLSSSASKVASSSNVTSDKSSSSTGKVSSSSADKATSSSSKGKSSSSSETKLDSTAYEKLDVVAIKNKSISGLSQKGPFVTGSTVKLYELDGKTYAQTGKSFTGKIASDDGKFSISSVNLASQYALLEANGYFRNEVTGEKSRGTITLNALTDLSNRKSVNINLLTHLEYERALYLVGKGLNVPAAKKQAEAEIFKAFSIQGDFANSEDLDIFSKGEGNAALLAISVLMLADLSYEGEAELTERLTKFATDIEKDGKWDDEVTKAKIADAIQSVDLWSELSYIRRGIEGWNLGSVPDFEKYLRNFWYANYGIGDCDKTREGEVMAAKNEKSSTYGTATRFICKSEAWVWASALEKDTYKWSDGKDGDIKTGDVTKSRKYVYDGKQKKWREATELENVLGSCTEKRETEISLNTGKVYGTWYICKNREWSVTDSITVDLQGWGKGKDGEIKKGDSTSAFYKYDEALNKWMTATHKDSTLKLNGCTTKRENEVGKSPKDNNYYVCDNMDWRTATGVESVLGVCTKAREKDISSNTGRVGDSWYICKELKWESTYFYIVDTQGWSKASDGKIKKGDSTAAFYKYDEVLNKWLVATQNDTTLKLNVCTTNHKDEISKSVVNDVYYVCTKMDYFVSVNEWLINEHVETMDWRKASKVEYDTYGETCSSAEVGKIINGVVTSSDKYYCSANGWVNFTDGWSWDVPKELRFNPEISYGTMTDSRDNKKYKTIQIGNQIWMAENLNYADSAATPSLKGKSRCIYCNVAGRYYTWTAAIDSVKLAADADNPLYCGIGKKCGLTGNVQGICPNGWHLPSKGEWDVLISAVGGPSKANAVLRAKSPRWKAPTWYKGGEDCVEYGTDDVGFTAMPVGYYHSGISELGNSVHFWSSTEYDSDQAYFLNLYCFTDYIGLLSFYEKKYMYSVRCVKD